MADVTPITQPFSNKGLMLKQDASLLAPTQYSELTNVVSVQEGNLSPRAGNQNITTAAPFGTDYTGGPFAIDELITGSGAGTTLYVGTFGKGIFSNGSGSFTTVATAATSGQFSASSYNAGSSGSPYKYFATGSGNLKDNGTLTTLQNWGILPPVIPAQAALAAITVLPQTTASTTYDIVDTISGAVTTRLPTAVTVVTVGGSAPGTLTITPSAMSGILVGTLLTIGGMVVPVLSSDTGLFTAYMTAAPSVGAAITASEFSTVGTTAAPATIPVMTPAPSPINAAFDGVATDAYSTVDPVHIAITLSNPAQVTDIRLRCLVNGSSSDYYEAPIGVSTLQTAINLSVTAQQAAQLEAENQAAIQWSLTHGYEGQFDLGSIIPNQLIPTSPVSATYVPWTELDIPKNQFVSVGNAGSNPFSWANVTGFQVVYTVVAGTTPTIGISSIYIAGGFGPNAVSTLYATLQPYRYVFTYRNPTTGAEGNPCVEMIPSLAVVPARQQIQLSLYGTNDAQIPQTANSPSISVYRQGGSFTDSYYRFVGYATNPGAGNYVTFLDAQSDASIDVNNIALMDNDAPVTSALPTPLSLGFVAYYSGSGLAGAISSMHIQVLSGSPGIGPGTVITVAPNTSVQEQCICIGIDIHGGVELFFQYAHPAASFTSGQVALYNDTVAAKACKISCAAFDSLFLAGDSYNPQVLYKSKSGQPEAFPIIDLETQTANAINVGSPSNYIVNITEFQGGIACLNYQNIFWVMVVSGIMQAPVQTPASRGLIAQRAWCRVDNEIWYLSYDGIYSWGGGESMWRSEAIDPLFRGVAIGPYAPINLTLNSFTGASGITMAYSGNEIFVSYYDTNGVPHRLRYHTKFDRWNIETQYDPNQSGNEIVPVTAQFIDPASGNFYITKYANSTPYLYIDGVGTTDGWVSAATDGSAIAYAFTPAAYVMNAPSVNKNYLDFGVELSSGDACVVQTFYGFSGTQDQAFTIATQSVRGRVFNSIQNGLGKENYAMQLRFSGSSVNGSTFNSVTMDYVPLTAIQVGRAYDWDDCQYTFDKKFFQLVMEYDIPQGTTVVMNMDTMTGLIGNYQENPAVQSFTLTPPTTTIGTPNRIQANFAINDGTVAKLVRLRPTVVNVPFKHFSYSFPDYSKYPADITLFTEWGIEGYPYQKELQTLELEINTGGVPCVVQTQGDGSNIGPAFTVTTTLNNRVVMESYPPDLTAKNLRLVFTPGTNGYAQYFRHKFGYIEYPPDSQQYAEWSDLGYPGDKILRVLNLEMNTNGAPCVVAVDGDGTTLSPLFTVTTNFATRAQILAMGSNQIARNVRLNLAPTGVAQYFKHSFSFIKEPLAVNFFDSYEFNFGYKGYNFIKQGWLEYECASRIDVIFYVDDAQIFYIFSLPSHANRDVERFYFPDFQNVSGSIILNKSKIKRFTITSATATDPFKLYADGSGFEWMPCGKDQHSAYQQSVVSTLMGPSIAAGQ